MEWFKENGSREGSPPCGLALCRACGPALVGFSSVFALPLLLLGFY
jgi:hypothetical protein